MARYGGAGLFHIITRLLLTMMILPAYLSARPTGRHLKGDVGLDLSGSLADSASPSKMLSRGRRNISWYNQHSDFWSWYKYFTDTGNQEGVQELDRVYLAYLQNKNRAEGRRSYNMYLRHLGDIYKSCAESDDPNCVASYISRPRDKGEVPRAAPVKACDPHRDPYCSRSYPAMAPTPAKAPAWAPVLRSPPKAFNSAPVLQPMLSAEQQAELLRICDAKDAECLQYHLRAAYGYNAAAGPAPSYAFLGCDPRKDPGCRPRPVQKAPSGQYHRYLTCDPNYDPYCLPHAAQSMEAPTCNPLYDENCNPLTGTWLAKQERDAMDDPAAGAACDPRYDPYCPYRVATPMLGHNRQPEEETRHSLGPRGKTKEGYDCYMYYDKECHPLDTVGDPQTAASSPPEAPARAPHHDATAPCHPFDPGCGRTAALQKAELDAYEPHLNPDGTRDGSVVEPDPDCDPEYDHGCRLRRVQDPGAREKSQDLRDFRGQLGTSVQHKEPYHKADSFLESPSYDQQLYEPYQSGQEDPYASYGPQDHEPMPHEDVLGDYARYDESQVRHPYGGEYRKK